MAFTQREASKAFRIVTGNTRRMQSGQRTHLGARDPNVQHGGARKAHNSCLCMSPGDASSLTQLDEFVKVVDMRDGDAAQRFTNSLKETGFAVVTNHGLDYSLVSSVYAEWRDFYVSGQVLGCSIWIRLSCCRMSCACAAARPPRPHATRVSGGPGQVRAERQHARRLLQHQRG